MPEARAERLEAFQRDRVRGRRHFKPGFKFRSRGHRMFSWRRSGDDVTRGGRAESVAICAPRWVHSDDDKSGRREKEFVSHRLLEPQLGTGDGLLPRPSSSPMTLASPRERPRARAMRTDRWRFTSEMRILQPAPRGLPSPIRTHLTAPKSREIQLESTLRGPRRSPPHKSNGHKGNSASPPPPFILHYDF